MTDPVPPQPSLPSRIAGAPHAVALGFVVIEVTPGRSVVRAEYREDLVGDPDTGVIAGGVITAMLDHTCGVAVFAHGGGPPLATLDLRIDYMRAAVPGETVYASAHCFKVTRNVAFVRARAYEKDPEDPIATASAAFMLRDALVTRKDP